LKAIDAEHQIRYEIGGRKLGLDKPHHNTRVKRRLYTRTLIVEEEDATYKGMLVDIDVDFEDELEKIKRQTYASGTNALATLNECSAHVSSQIRQTGTDNDKLEVMAKSMKQSQAHFDALDRGVMQTLLSKHDWIQLHKADWYNTAFGFAAKGNHTFVPGEVGEEVCCIIKTHTEKTLLRSASTTDGFYKIRACQYALYIIDLNDDEDREGDHPQLHSIIEYTHIKDIKIGLHDEIRIELKHHVYKKHVHVLDKYRQFPDGIVSIVAPQDTKRRCWKGCKHGIDTGECRWHGQKILVRYIMWRAIKSQEEAEEKIQRCVEGVKPTTIPEIIWIQPTVLRFTVHAVRQSAQFRYESTHVQLEDDDGDFGAYIENTNKMLNKTEEINHNLKKDLDQHTEMLADQHGKMVNNNAMMREMRQEASKRA